MTDALHVKLRPLEREDLRFVHQLDNNASVMRYWFEEPYEAFVELSDLYDKHIHDQSERRFVIECNGDKAGLVELVEINHVHRRFSLMPCVWAFSAVSCRICRSMISNIISILLSC